ncbi:aldo/keto reductase [Inquilinus sp. Marseille-Q2685]|uniref:aldo/keto reductase n=1 Tax=Inquilinus sp. Marseille-Q2685 TaxID=2866581 RepID=UPI001CE44FCB|nr:aldo/keto reductase [Inquilinus sp. Marseille-Q2685]
MIAATPVPVSSPPWRGAAALGLGTAQFGLDYGIANDRGLCPPGEVAAILETAAASGIGVLDTAPAYGTAEQVLGEVLPAAHRFRIVTKTPHLAGLRHADDIGRAVHDAFAASRTKLRRDRLAGLLTHNANDLLRPGGPGLWAAMEDLKRAGEVERIGASVYSAGQLAAVLARYPLDIVQLPWNAVDGRIGPPLLAAMAERGIELHARSVFLQGLLLAPPAHAARVSPEAEALVGRWRGAVAAAGTEPLAAALGAVIGRPEIGTALVGVTRPEELAGILRAVAAAPPPAAPVQSVDDLVLNPALWPSGDRPAAILTGAAVALRPTASGETAVLAVLPKEGGDALGTIRLGPVDRAAGEAAVALENAGGMPAAWQDEAVALTARLAFEQLGLRRLTAAEAGPFARAGWTAAGGRLILDGKSYWERT